MMNQITTLEELRAAGYVADYRCLDCGVHTKFIGEYYAIHDYLWILANPQRKGMLCIGCLERRLGRMLRPPDFKDCPINDPDYTDWQYEKAYFSQRFLTRLGYEATYNYEYYQAAFIRPLAESVARSSTRHQPIHLVATHIPPGVGVK